MDAKRKLHFEDAFEPFVYKSSENKLFVQSSNIKQGRKLFINRHDVRKRNEAIIASLDIEINVYPLSSQCWISN